MLRDPAIRRSGIKRESRSSTEATTLPSAGAREGATCWTAATIFGSGISATTEITPAIYIGTVGTQTSFFAAGVNGVTTGSANAVPVMIDSNGQLGTVNSSAKFKEDIQDMGESSSALMRLRPVTYRYKKPYADGAKPLDYGLIAEEVEEIYPDLVVRSADGAIQTVQYQKVNAMLLNEVQKEHAQIEDQKTELRGIEKLAWPSSRN